jgi:hypothetical protein
LGGQDWGFISVKLSLKPISQALSDGTTISKVPVLLLR